MLKVCLDRRRSGRPTSRFVCGRSVLAEVPAFAKDGEQIQAARTLRFLWGIKGALWMELTVANSEYVRDAFRESPPLEAQQSSPFRKRRKRGRKAAGDIPALQEVHEEAAVEDVELVADAVQN